MCHGAGWIVQDYYTGTLNGLFTCRIAQDRGVRGLSDRIWDLAMVAVEMAPGRSGSSGESCVRCVDVLFSGAKDGLCGVSHTKLIGKVINCVRFIYKGVSQYWE